MAEAFSCLARRTGRGLRRLGSRLGNAWRGRDLGGPHA